MAHPRDLDGELAELEGQAPFAADPEDFDKNLAPQSLRAVDRTQEKLSRSKAMSLKLAGFTTEKIAEQLDVTESAVLKYLERVVERVDQRNVDAYRELEKDRLDKVQTAIWTKVLRGDLRAIDTFLRISQRRAKLLGLDMPENVHISVGIRQEMQTALSELENVILGEVVKHDDDDGPAELEGS